jgi:mannose-6-phosphate isomerase
LSGNASVSARPEITPFEPFVVGKIWGEEWLVAHVPGEYAGKMLKRYVDGHRGGLQFHESRRESFYLFSGEVIVYWVDADGVLRKRAMHPGQTFDVPPGAVHSVQTLTDSVMFEVSNGAYPDAVRVEQDYDIETAVES